MLTLNDITNVSFRKSNFSGYKPEDVDAFVDQVRDSYEQLLKKNMEQKDAHGALQEENEQLRKKIEVLADKIETYRSEEDEIKTALISAQKLGDASVREARHKAEIIIKDANIKSERIVSGAKAQTVQYEQQLEALKKSVSDFRSHLMEMYREHLTLINELPAQKQPEPEVPELKAEEKPAEEPAQASSISSADEDDDYQLDVTAFSQTAEPDSSEKDLRYDMLHFDTDRSHDANEDPNSPVDIFKRNK